LENVGHSESELGHRAAPALPSFPLYTAQMLGFSGAWIASEKLFDIGSHQGMVDIAAAVYQSTRKDPKLGPLTENQVGDMMDKVCAAKPDSKVIDALQQQ
jgi:hypothetical protein